MLTWWKGVKNQYTVMSIIARDILAMPVSRVASKSALSAGQCILDEKMNRMIDEIIEMVLYFKDWLDVEIRLQDKDVYNTTFDDDDTDITDD